MISQNGGCYDFCCNPKSRFRTCDIISEELPFFGWLLSEILSGIDLGTEEGIQREAEGLARRKKKGTISENYALEEPKAITFTQTKLFPTKKEGDPDAKTVLYSQKTRMATTGRIAAEGNIVTSLEDAAFLLSPN